MKAVHLVLAVHDHFSQKANRTRSSSQSIVSAVDPNNPLDHTLAIPATPQEDLWALDYITIQRVQPLIEALDWDGSSFVTVNELNAFSSARPEGWRYGILLI